MIYLTRYLPCYIWPGICHAIFDTGICHAIFDTGICHAIFDTCICHAIFDTCCTWHVTSDTGTQYLHRYSVFTPTLDTWSTALDIRHRYLICHTWHLILTPGIWHMLTLSWYAFMWYKHLDLTSWPLTGHYHPWYLYYLAYSWLSLLRDLAWLLYYYQIFGTPVLLNLWTPEPLKKGDSWYHTPDIILLLILVVG